MRTKCRYIFIFRDILEIYLHFGDIIRNSGQDISLEVDISPDIYLFRSKIYLFQGYIFHVILSYIPKIYLFGEKIYLSSNFQDIFLKICIIWDILRISWDIISKRYIFLEIFPKKIYPPNVSPDVTLFFILYLTRERIYLPSEKIYLQTKKIYLLGPKIYLQVRFLPPNLKLRRQPIWNSSGEKDLNSPLNIFPPENSK